MGFFSTENLNKIGADLQGIAEASQSLQKSMNEPGTAPGASSSGGFSLDDLTKDLHSIGDFLAGLGGGRGTPAIGDGAGASSGIPVAPASSSTTTLLLVGGGALLVVALFALTQRRR